jgi:predicted CoA-binding protein
LANQRIALTGVSRTPKTHGSNTVYQRLRERGYEVFAVNPNAHEVEGDRCYKDLKSIPGRFQLRSAARHHRDRWGLSSDVWAHGRFQAPDHALCARRARAKAGVIRRAVGQGDLRA